MKRPSRKDIKARIDSLKDKSSEAKPGEPIVPKLTEKKTSKRIRKQGI